MDDDTCHPDGEGGGGCESGPQLALVKEGLGRRKQAAEGWLVMGGDGGCSEGHRGDALPCSSWCQASQDAEH